MPPPPGGRLAVHDRPYLVGYLPVDGLRAERAERAAHLSAPPPPPRPYAAPAAGPPRGGSVAVTAAHVRGVLARDPGPPRNGAPAPVGRGAGHLVPGPAASRGVPAQCSQAGTRGSSTSSAGASAASRDGRPSSLEELPRLIGDLRLDEHATGARMRAIHCVGARLFFEWRDATARFPGESQPPWPWTAWRAPVR